MLHLTNSIATLQFIAMATTLRTVVSPVESQFPQETTSQKSKFDMSAGEHGDWYDWGV